MRRYFELKNWLIFPILIISIFGNLAGNYYLCRRSDSSLWLYSGMAPANGQLTWTKIQGYVSEISVNGKGEMLVVGNGNVLYYSRTGWNGATCNWIKQTGPLASKVAIAADKFVYIDTNNKMYYYSGAVPATGIIPWVPIDGTAISVAINSSGQMVYVGTDGALWYSAGVVGTSGGWKKIGGVVKKVVLGEKNICFIGTNDSIYCGTLPPDANNNITWTSEWSGTVSDVAVSSSGEMLKIVGNVVYFAPIMDYATHKATWVASPGTVATHVAMAASEGTPALTTPTITTSLTPAIASPDPLATLYNSVAAVTKANMLASSFDVTAFLAQIAQLKASATYATNATVLAQEQLAIKVKSIQTLKSTVSGLSSTNIPGLSTVLSDPNYISASIELRK